MPLLTRPDTPIPTITPNLQPPPPALPPAPGIAAHAIAIPVLNPAPAANNPAAPLLNHPPPQGWRFTALFENWSLSRKIFVAVFLTAAIFAIATAIAVPLSESSENPTKKKADAICTILPQIAAPYLNCTAKPIIQVLQSNITGMVTHLCRTKITDPVAINAAKGAMYSLKNDLANQSIFCATGAFYYPNNPSYNDSTPLRAYELVYHSLVDCMDLTLSCNIMDDAEEFYIPGWVGWYTDAKMITKETMRQVALVALQILCNRKVTDASFGQNLVNCLPNAQIPQLIVDFAGWGDVLPKKG